MRKDTKITHLWIYIRIKWGLDTDELVESFQWVRCMHQPCLQQNHFRIVACSNHNEEIPLLEFYKNKKHRESTLNACLHHLGRHSGAAVCDIHPFVLKVGLRRGQLRREPGRWGEQQGQPRVQLLASASGSKHGLWQQCWVEYFFMLHLRAWPLRC